MKMNSKSLIKYIIYVITAIFVMAAVELGIVFKKVYRPNIVTPDKLPFDLYIPTGSTYGDVLDSLYSHHLVRNRSSFEWAVQKKKYQNHVHGGHYLIRNGISNNDLVNMLKAGLQQPVNVVINNARTLGELSAKISHEIEPDSASIRNLLDNDQFIAQYGFNEYTIMGMFIPNTYEVWWNTSTEDFIERMYKEYQKFWTPARMNRAREINMSPNEVITMASIIISESNKEDEYNRIAGLYVNRLNKGIKLQADPTVIYALGDFSRQRVLKKDTEVDSPYNTYLHYGLPPGPIAIPSIKAIDAVLNYEKHNYLYFCARDDFSGYHVFSRTLEQHNRNAQLYQNALNRRKILK